MKNDGRTFTREELESFLATAPDQLKDWAQQQLARFDETRQEAPEDGDDDGADLSDLLPEGGEDEDNAEVDTPRVSALERRAGVSPLNLVLVTLLAAAIVVIVQMAGRPQPEPTTAMPSNHPPIDASSSLAAMDQAQKLDKDSEAELKAQIEADPANVEARLKLGTLYYNASLYSDMIPQLQSVLDQDPDNLDALLGIGAAEYKTTQYDAAEKHWLRVTELAPQRAEPWYSLGFLYMARTPADPARAREAWNKVIEIGPDSDMAKEVTPRLSSLPTPTAAPSSEG